MNEIHFKLTYKFVSNRVNLLWSDIAYAINRNILPQDSAIEHAIIKISQSKDYNQVLFDLASLFKGESVQPYLNELVRLEKYHDEKSINEKWLYLILAWIFENKDSYVDPLGVVEQVYADFDYPKEVATFVRYMPTEEVPLDTKEMNESRLYKKWEEYLDIQRKKFLY